MSKKRAETIFDDLIFSLVAIIFCIGIAGFFGPRYMIVAVGIGAIIGVYRAAWKRSRFLELASVSFGVAGVITMAEKGFAYPLRHPHLTSIQVFIHNWPWLLGGIVAIVLGFLLWEWQGKDWE